MKDWIRKCGENRKKIYSQDHQDGVLEHIFDNIGTTNSSPFCVEVGFNHPTLRGGSGSNVANLVLHKGWDSLLLDSDNHNPQINLYKHFLTSENICGIFKKYNVPREPDYVSIDVDSTDLWLFKAVLTQYRPRVLSVEYNSAFPLEDAITFPNNTNERYEGDRGHGASLKALNMVAEENGYSLVYVVRRLDTFFVRNDLLDDGSSNLVPPFEYWEGATAFPCHVALHRPFRINIFIDYAEYMRTNGDLEKSRAGVAPICQKYLVDAPILPVAIRRAKYK